MQKKKIGIVGAGAWGTALAQAISQTNEEVILWAHRQATTDNINNDHINHEYLPAIPLNGHIITTSNLNALHNSDIILMVTPAQTLREIAIQLSTNLKPGAVIVVCSKGIEIENKALMSDVLSEVLPDTEISILSGPSFADEVAKGLPAALTLACSDQQLGIELIHTLGHTNLRLYWSDDIIGAQIGGAAKNVMAIACGISEGKNLGKNALAALTTRGFVELLGLGQSFGGKPETLTGLSGLGDLILTCSSPKSRNMSLGIALGQGNHLEDILRKRTTVTEGIYTAKAVAEIAKDKGLILPITQAVDQILSGNISVQEAIESLLARPFKAEH